VNYAVVPNGPIGGHHVVRHIVHHRTGGPFPWGYRSDRLPEPWMPGEVRVLSEAEADYLVATFPAAFEAVTQQTPISDALAARLLGADPPVSDEHLARLLAAEPPHPMLSVLGADPPLPLPPPPTPLELALAPWAVDIVAALEAGTHDALLGDLVAAEIAGKGRRTVLDAVASRAFKLAEALAPVAPAAPVEPTVDPVHGPVLPPSVPPEV
jgi:hypothetical protein